MAASNVVHSNAFNFMDYLQSGVDMRTGQYLIGIDFPAINANQLRGPTVPLHLSFSPLNTQDSGFGKGWSLNLSQFTPASKMVALSTGETFKVTGSGENADVRERKLTTFQFSFLANNTYRIVHKSGLVEELTEFGTGVDAIALPYRIYAPSGHAVYLEYKRTEFGISLESIRDEKVQLLKINYVTNDTILIDFAPNSGADGGPIARYQLGLTSRIVDTIVIPSGDAASWRLEYDFFNDFLCLLDVKTPLGGHETIHYDSEGHAYPIGAGERKNLPRVGRHMMYPGADQGSLRTDYTYTGSGSQVGHNFLGFGAPVDWDPQGVDNLYNAPSDYTYSTTSMVMINNEVVRTHQNTYNRFHLLINEHTQQEDCIKQVTTTYYNTSDSFDRQPKQFQLPMLVESRWSLGNDATRTRVESVHSTFDESGNLLEEVQNNGIATTYSYYPALGEGDDCPADPYGFVRYVKSKTVTPSSEFLPGGQALQTLYRYLSLPALSASGQKSWIVSSSERLFDVSGSRPVEVQHSGFTWINAPEDVFNHGQPEGLLETFGPLMLHTRTQYAYSVVDHPLTAEPVLQVVQTRSGFDDQSKITTLLYSLFNGEPVLIRDDNETEILYTHDALQRVTSETVAPNTDYTATRYYEYSLTSGDNQRASQVATDVKGVKTRSVVDGLNRVILEERYNADVPEFAETYRTTYRAVYNAIGDMQSETVYDWRGIDDVALTSIFEYDDWGQQQSVVGPDGVRVWEKTDPIGSSAWDKGPVVTSWSESTLANDPLKTGAVVTWINSHGSAERIERFCINGDSYSFQKNEFDGLGRVIHEANEFNNITTYQYDVFNRVITRTLPDGAKEERGFALHSPEDLPVVIKVNGIVLGYQEFDSLGRMTSSITGGRKQTYTYGPGETLPKTVTPHSLQLTEKAIEYKYIPQLGEDPVWRQLPDSLPERYEYDERNARMISCYPVVDDVRKDDQLLSLRRDYFSTGQLKCEVQTQGTTEYQMTFDYSLQGLLLSYTDVLNQVQEYKYTNAGQIVSTQLEDHLVSSFTYDGLGRTKTIVTEDTSGTRSRSVEIELEYDDFGREVSRRFNLDGTLQVLTQCYNKADLIESRKLCEGETLLRNETYLYDPRSRLQSYACEGTQPPVDPYGQVITAQDFIMDGLDNITQVITFSDDIVNVANYHYESEDDPVQLTRITNTETPTYPESILLEYDLNGNLTKDELGRTLVYDPLNRLLSVSLP
ncbi:RHS repeat domain-containing protein [Pseudomonas sp. SIMBA_077]